MPHRLFSVAWQLIRPLRLSKKKKKKQKKNNTQTRGHIADRPFGQDGPTPNLMEGGWRASLRSLKMQKEAVLSCMFPLYFYHRTSKGLKIGSSFLSPFSEEF